MRGLSLTTAILAVELAFVPPLAAQEAAQEALGGDAAAREELETKVGREDLGDLLNAGRVLKEGGVLDDVGKEGTDLAKALTDALKELTESKREVKDVKRQSMDITGTLKIEGKTATLAATEGLV